MDGFEGFRRRAIAIRIEQSVLSLKFHPTCECRLARPVRTRNQREDGHVLLGGASLQFADNLVVPPGWGAGNPADLEPPPIRLFHYIQAIVIPIADR